MKRRNQDERLFQPEPPKKPDKSKIPSERIWTRNKALLISRYIYYFQLITKHGTYIDGFAGPQDPKAPDSWAAGLVLGLEPLRLRHFHLCDKSPSKFLELERLKAAQSNRDIHLYFGDFNERVAEILKPDLITPKEATFCLIDQQTFECKWSTVTAVAEFKSSAENKIEIFYFLAEWWIHQAFGGIKSKAGLKKVQDWWGRADLEELRTMKGTDRAQLVAERFKDEFNYRYSNPYAIYEKKEGKGRVAYYMIHATDHHRAPALMSAAYKDAVLPPKPVKQISMELGLPPEEN